MTKRRALLVFCVVLSGLMVLGHRANTVEPDMKDYWQQEDAEQRRQNTEMLRAFDTCKARKIEAASPLLDCITEEMRRNKRWM